MSMAVLLLSCAVLTAQNQGLENLDFAHKNLAGWGGKGFQVGTMSVGGGAEQVVVTSKDPGQAGVTGQLHRAIRLPEGVEAIRVLACAIRPPGQAADDRLDVAVLTPERQIIPKMVLVTAKKEWSPVRRLLPPEQGRLREYRWSVADRAGQMVQLVVADADDRPGCYVLCGGFQLLTKAGDVFVERPRPAPAPAPAPAPRPVAKEVETGLALLLSQLKTGDVDERIAAAQALGKQRESAQAAGNDLIRALGDPSPKVRLAVVRVLGQQGALIPESIPALLGRLEDERESLEFRIAAARSLGAMGQAGTPAVPRLLNLLTLLGWLRDLQKPPIPLATGVIASRSMAGTAVPGDPVYSGQLDNVIAQSYLGSIMAQDLSTANGEPSKGGTLAAAVRDALVAIGEPAVPGLIGLLGYRGVTVRFDAIFALKAIGPPAQAASSALRRIAVTVRGYPFGTAALDALRRIDPPAAVALEEP